MEKIKNFYKNKRVLVTGATGFKGSWLCFWLNLLKAKDILINRKTLAYLAVNDPDAFSEIVKSVS